MSREIYQTIGAALDLARTIIRRAERMAVKLLHDGIIHNGEVARYLNGLSDLVFILARSVEVKSSLAECRSNPATRRGRFIAPIADLSALSGFSKVIGLSVE